MKGDSTMGESAIENRIRKLKAIEEQQKHLEQEAELLRAEIKKDLEIKGTEECSRNSTETFTTSLRSRRPADGLPFHRGRKTSMNYSTLTVEDCIRKQEQEGNKSFSQEKFMWANTRAIVENTERFIKQLELLV